MGGRGGAREGGVGGRGTRRMGINHHFSYKEKIKGNIKMQIKLKNKGREDKR